MARSKNFHQKRAVSHKVHHRPRKSVPFFLHFSTRLAAAVLSPLRGPVKGLLLIISLWLMIGSFVLGTKFFLYQKALMVRNEERQKSASKLAGWKKILSEHPTAREALLGAYSCALSLGDDESAKQYLEQLKRVDPNDPRVKALN